MAGWLAPDGRAPEHAACQAPWTGPRRLHSSRGLPGPTAPEPPAAPVRTSHAYSTGRGRFAMRSLPHCRPWRHDHRQSALPAGAMQLEFEGAAVERLTFVQPRRMCAPARSPYATSSPSQYSKRLPGTPCMWGVQTSRGMSMGCEQGGCSALSTTGRVRSGSARLP